MENQWINCKDRLPEPTTDSFLVYYTFTYLLNSIGDNYTVASFDNGFWYSDDNGRRLNVTHWQLLKPPTT